ncbi:hypothetical protein ACVLV4_000453 [Rathayibacter agropyri]
MTTEEPRQPVSEQQPLTTKEAVTKRLGRGPVARYLDPAPYEGLPLDGARPRPEDVISQPGLVDVLREILDEFLQDPAASADADADENSEGKK